MRKLKILAKNVDKFMRVTDSLVGKHVVVKHNKYPQIQDIVKKVYKMPGVDTKQVNFEDAQPILIRRGDKFIIEVLT